MMSYTSIFIKTNKLVLLIALCSLFSCDSKNNQKIFYSTFRGDNTHRGKYISKPIIHRPSLKWEFKTGAPVNSSVALDEQNVYFGSGDSNFYCVKQSTGLLNWKFKTEGGIYSTAALLNGIIFFGSYDGFFYALNSKDGSLKWSFKSDGERRFSAPGIHGHLPKDSVFEDEWDFFVSSPVIDNGIIYFGTGSGYFYALDAATGKQQWKFKTNGIIHSSPAIAFNNVYFGSWDTYLYALNKNTGKEVWKFKTGIDTVIYNQTGMQGSPAISDNTLYFGCRDSHLYALNAADGKLLWKRFNDYSWVSSCPVIEGDKIIYTTGDGRSLVALNKFTGDSIYQMLSKGWIFSSPSLVDNVVYYGDLNGFLYANDITNGKQLWSYQLESSKKDLYKILGIDSVLNYGVVFSKEKKEAEHKTSMEMLYSLGSIHSSPVIRDGVIYFTSTNGNVYAVE
jgi:outer membrane protein assembly factor BamB